MGIFACLIIPVVALLVILWVLKWANFTMIPPDLQLPKPGKFEIPKVRREGYTWETDDSSDEEEEEYEEEYEEERPMAYF